MSQTATLENLHAALVRHGLLLESDPVLPSVVTLVAGEPVRGSWWGHPLGNRIYNLSGELYDHPDVLCAKLVGGKITYVHRPLWPALLAVASAREPWQTEGLPYAAKSILDAVTRHGQQRTDDLPRIDGRSPSRAVAELEKRLLLHGFQIHTPAGHHARVLQAWEAWAEEHELPAGELTPAEGKGQIEAAYNNLKGSLAAKAKLPWT